MIQIREATFFSGTEGAALRAIATVGDQTVTMTLPVTSDDLSLRHMVEALAPKVQRVIVRRNASGGEIVIVMLVGGRAYVAHLPFEGTAPELLAALEHLIVNAEDQ